jgi:hypothetical protein
MPLAFESLSHGTIAFGFFNIESNMLMCDRYFFFADCFCDNLKKIAEWDEDRFYRSQWPVWFLESAADIGDLMGAIHGVRFSGFLGELYRRFPFPQNPADFKQSPRGHETQSQVSEIIAAYGRIVEIDIAISPGGSEVVIGRYQFSRMQFQKILEYIWRGGYPRWKNETRPAYLMALKETIMKNPRGIYKDLVFGS